MLVLLVPKIGMPFFSRISPEMRLRQTISIAVVRGNSGALYPPDFQTLERVDFQYVSEYLRADDEKLFAIYEEK